MPQFTTISPTSVPGKKEYAWRKFLQGGYAAIGWLSETNLSGKSLDEIEKLLETEYPDQPAEVSLAKRAFERFLSLQIGDYVAVPNVRFGLFGVGVVKSEYQFKEFMHDIGSENRPSGYSHYREVDWVVRDYHERSDILLQGEKEWMPYGTIGKVQPQLPAYIARLVGLATEPASQQPQNRAPLRPEFLEDLIRRIDVLRKDEAHKERDHESLVEDFFVSLGYAKQVDLKFRRGHIDLSISRDGLQLAVVEAKRTWDLDFENGKDHVKQAYQYAHENGVRYVIVTNGDDYILFDRLKGLSWESNLVGEWKLTALSQEDLEVIDRLRPGRLSRPDLGELFHNLSEAFGKNK